MLYLRKFTMQWKELWMTNSGNLRNNQNNEILDYQSISKKWVNDFLNDDKNHRLLTYRKKNDTFLPGSLVSQK